MKAVVITKDDRHLLYNVKKDAKQIQIVRMSMDANPNNDDYGVLTYYRTNEVLDDCVVFREV